MKATTLKSSLLVLLAIGFVGCGSGKSSKLASSPATPTPPTDSGNGTGSGTNTPTEVKWPYSVGGETVSFVPVSWEEMNSYVGLRPLNNPSNAMLNMEIRQVPGVGLFFGKVRLGYTDNGQFYYGEFSVGEGKNTNCSNCQNNGDYEAAYNYWTTINGKRTFMAYFQDQYGSIILALEDSINSGDASGGSILSGRVYYRNFAQSIYPQSPYRKCWYITSGPYACYSNAMAYKSSSTDLDGYRLLGRVSGVRAFKAFQQ
jgi:hypothetical protein